MGDIVLKDQLTSYRKFHNYTQEDIAARLNVQRQTYSNYERGSRTPDVNTLISLARLYGVLVDDLLNTNPGCLTDASAVYPDNSATSVDSRIHLNGTEARLIADYRSLTETKRSALRSYLKFLKTTSDSD